MKSRDRWGFLAGIAVVLLTGYAVMHALAQPSGGVVNLGNPLSGNELITVTPSQANGQLGAYNANITLEQIAYFVANSTVSTTASGTVAMTTPTLILSAALTGALTVDLPATPTDGEIAVISNQSGAGFTQIITISPAITPAANGSLVNMPSNGSAKFQYSMATMTWTRIA